MADFMHGMTRKTVRANGIRLNVWSGGEGPALLLLHGYPQTGQMWRKMTPSLIKQFSVVCPDLRGYGDSDKPRDGYDKRTMAKDMAELMRALGHEHYAVVGHDRGGRVGRLRLRDPCSISGRQGHRPKHSGGRVRPGRSQRDDQVRAGRPGQLCHRVFVH